MLELCGTIQHDGKVICNKRHKGQNHKRKIFDTWNSFLIMFWISVQLWSCHSLYCLTCIRFTSLITEHCQVQHKFVEKIKAKSTHQFLKFTPLRDKRHQRPWFVLQPSWRNVWPWQWLAVSVNVRVPTTCNIPERQHFI